MGAGQKRSRPSSSSNDLVDSGSAPGSGSGSGSGSTPGALLDDMSVFRPPMLRSAALTAANKLNKALFTQTFDISAARIHDPRHISKYQKELIATQELLRLERLSSVVDDPEPSAGLADPAASKPPARRKCLLLRSTVSPTASKTWSDVLKEGVERDELGVIPYKLTLDYDHWTSREILVSVLPEEFHDDIPTGFNTAGHVAHLNLRSRFEPYKYIVGEVLLDKNPQLRTVINKTDLVGTQSAFRTFGYEVLAGPDDLQVEVRENFCTYRFDYSRVYWNSKLEPEHTRLLQLFRPGQVVVDVMAGIGPFAVPAGRRGVFVWANDMNPDSYAALCDAIERNKVGAYVRPSNEDGLVFIRQSADLVRAAAAAGEGAAEVTAPSKNKGKGESKAKAKSKANPPRCIVPVPPTVDHFVMNLPASAITFLPKFRGLYAGTKALFGVASGQTEGRERGAQAGEGQTAQAQVGIPAAQEEARSAAEGNAEAGIDAGVDTSAGAKAGADVGADVRAGTDTDTGTGAGTGVVAAPAAVHRLPIIHVHCFAPKNDEDDSISKHEVRERVAEQVGVSMRLVPRYADIEQDDSARRSADEEHLVYVHNVRAVAPQKSMFCASFRLPAAMAFAPRE